MFSITFYAEIAYAPYTIVVEAEADVDTIVYSGANIVVVNMVTNEWRDACGGKYVSNYAPKDKPSEIIV